MSKGVLLKVGVSLISPISISPILMFNKTKQWAVDTMSALFQHYYYINTIGKKQPFVARPSQGQSGIRCYSAPAAL